MEHAMATAPAHRVRDHSLSLALSLSGLAEEAPVWKQNFAACKIAHVAAAKTSAEVMGNIKYEDPKGVTASRMAFGAY